MDSNGSVPVAAPVAPAIDGSFAPTPRPSVTAVEVDGEQLLLDEACGSLHLLDPIAGIVWSVLDGSATVDELAADLGDVFAADPGRVRADVLELVGDLAARGLLANPGTAGAVEPAPTPEPEDEDEPRVVERPGST